jgi:thiamine-phosphate pyrophosphorylase
VRLEDAFLYLVVDLAAVDRSAAPALCGEAVRGGADVIQVRSLRPADRGLAEDILGVCREQGALLIVGADAALAAAVGADGVHLARGDGGIGRARAAVGNGALVGMSSFTADEARLALAVGADYVLHGAGAGCRADFAAIGQGAGVPLFAGGVRTVEEAGEIVRGGLFRLGLEAGALGGTLTAEAVARYARLLGRVL